jgi:prepilin-type N-terminal cleavage/methylation domain-containing protein
MIDTFSGRLPDLQSERGFTLIELLVAMTLAAVIFTALGVALVSSQSVQARDTEWALTLQQGRSGLARMTREIRQATKVEEAKANLITFLATLNGKNWKIKYECSAAQSGTSYDECVRYAAEAGKSLPSKGGSVLRDVSNGSSVFTYSPNTTSPTVVSLKLELPAAGTLKQVSSKGYKNTIVLEDSAFMRNLDLTG